MQIQDEIVVIVDKDNHVIGAESRALMRAKGLTHRATYILVFNSRGDLFVQERTLTKDIYPGYYDVAAGGVVAEGESYDECAERELEEEMGIRGVPLKNLFEFYHSDGKNRVWGRVYECIYDGKIVLQSEEVSSGDYYSIKDILKMSENEPFTPDGLYVLRRYRNEF